MGLNITSLDVFIGKKIRAFRKKRQWGLKLLASELNISVQQLQKYESGVNKISASMLFEIAKIFCLSVENFFQELCEGSNNIKDGFNILLIEDDVSDEYTVRQAIYELPTKINLYSIQSGDKALEFLKNINQKAFSKFIKPDIILMELHLAKFNSLEFLKTIKKDKDLGFIPVIAITDGTTQDETLLFYNLNVNSLIIKASSVECFKEQIFKVLSYWTELVQLPDSIHKPVLS